MRYCNDKGDTAVCNSMKADKDGNVWVEINGQMPVKRNWLEFIKEFNSVVDEMKMKQRELGNE